MSEAFSNFPTGSYEDALKWIGYAHPRRAGELPVEKSAVQLLAGMVEDSNPSYWDEDWAIRTWGAVVAPPAQLQTWVIPLPWKPEGADTHIALASQVPLPGRSLINVTTDVTYERHARVGETVYVEERVTAVSPAKTSRVGTGHFVTTQATYSGTDGDVIAIYTNTLFRFDPSGEA